MTKKELIKKISKRLGYTQDTVGRVYDETVIVLLEEIKEKNRVNIPYIGTLILTKTSPRKYVLPDGTAGKSKPRKTVKIKPSSRLLKKI
ncbi:MAG: HU family DNA-binding protein [Candidatus Muiribacteriota bacterium]